MPVDLHELETMVAEVGEFPARDRSLKRAQEEMKIVLSTARETGVAPPPESVARYRSAIERYFQGFHREAQRHVQDIDRRLEQLAQLQFNAVAERGVAARRAELTKTVLAKIERL